MGGMAVSVMHVVGVIAMVDGLMPAAGSMNVRMALMSDMGFPVALVPMVVVSPVDVTVVEVVGVVAMVYGDVSAVGSVNVSMV